MWQRFSHVQYKSIQNSQILKSYIFHILQYFTTKLYNFTKFRKLFPTVLKLFSNLKVCLIGEWSIQIKLNWNRNNKTVPKLKKFFDGEYLFLLVVYIDLTRRDRPFLFSLVLGLVMHSASLWLAVQGSICMDLALVYYLFPGHAIT